MLTNNLIFLFEKEKEEKKYSIAKICQNIGITKQNYNMYKNGSEPTATNFYKISNYFKISMEKLLTEDLTKQNNNKEGE